MPVFGVPVACGTVLSCPDNTEAPLDNVNFWNFTTDIEGWSNPHNLTTNVANGICEMTITGSDPYILSPDNLNISASDYK